MNRKVTVVGGAGNVGATVARAIAVKELADVVIVDIAAEKAQGIALDIFQACPIDGSDTRLVGTGDLAVVVACAATPCTATDSPRTVSATAATNRFICPSLRIKPATPRPSPPMRGGR